MRTWTLAVGGLLALSSLGCSDTVDTPAPSDGAGGGEVEPALTGEWELLLEGEWTLIAGSEEYLCVVATVPQDMLVGAFRPIAPEGTHHTVLTRVTSAQPDGVYPCNAGTNGQNQIYGSGVGTNAFQFPPGVAVRLAQGEQLMLNLHLFNTSVDTLTGISGVEVIRIAAEDVVHEAEMTLAGTLEIELPPQQTTTVTGSCSFRSDKTLFGVFPHMHQLGRHMKVSVVGAGGDSVVHDAPYSFEDQRIFGLDSEMAVKAGDDVRVECTYDNTTDATVSFGDSSLAEMCFAGLAVYPATGISYLCVGF